MQSSIYFSSMFNYRSGCYQYLYQNQNQYQIQNQKIGKPLFSDNSLVYYKPHSLASGGIGTVKNARHKSKHI